MLENNFKTCYTGNFLKKHPDFGGLETNQRHEIQVFIFSHVLPHMNSINIKMFWALDRNLFKVLSFESKNLRKSAEKAKNLNFTIF